MFWLYLGLNSQTKNQNSREKQTCCESGRDENFIERKMKTKETKIWENNQKSFANSTYLECVCNFLWYERIYHWHHYLTEITWHYLDMLKTCILSWTDEIDNNLKIMEDDCHGDIWQVDVGQFSVLPVGLLRKFLPQHLFWICGNVKVCPSFSVSNHSDLIKSYKNKLQGKMVRTLDNHTFTAPSCSSIDLQSQTKIDPKSKIISLSPRRYDLALEVTGSSVIDPHKLNGTCLLVPLHNLVMMIRWPLTFNPPKGCWKPITI